MTRTRFLQFAAAAAFAAVLPLQAADQALPKGETILDRYVQATGGKAAYAKHKTQSSKVSMEFAAQGLKGTGTQFADANNNRVSVTLDNIGTMEMGVVDGVAWESNPMTGARLLEGAEKAERLRDDKFNGPVHWREFWKTAETQGVEAVKGEECYKVVLTPVIEGKTVTSWYSKKTGLLVKESRSVKTQMGEIPVEFYPSDYKDFDGVKVPTRITQQVMGSEIRMITDDIAFNVPLPKEKFEPPAEIRKLMAK